MHEKGRRFIHMGVTVHVTLLGRPTEIIPPLHAFLLSCRARHHDPPVVLCARATEHQGPLKRCFSVASEAYPRSPSNSLMLLSC